ncbi:hypothetical protein Cfor_11696, partial [Coptotermes formosanus]
VIRHFELLGCMRIQNRSGASTNGLLVKPLHSQRETAWSGILAFGIIGVYFIEDEVGNAVTVTSDNYMHTVHDFLLLELSVHFLFQKRWSSGTYFSAVDEHFKNCVRTSPNLSLW